MLVKAKLVKAMKSITMLLFSFQFSDFSLRPLHIEIQRKMYYFYVLRAPMFTDSYKTAFFIF